MHTRFACVHSYTLSSPTPTPPTYGDCKFEHEDDNYGDREGSISEVAFSAFLTF